MDNRSIAFRYIHTLTLYDGYVTEAGAHFIEMNEDDGM